MLVHSNEKDFKKNTIKGLVLVDFFATWCGPCRMLGTVLEDIQNDYNIVKVDTDECPKLAEEYSVMTIPNLFILKDGKIVSSRVGYQNKDQLIKWLEDNK